MTVDATTDAALELDDIQAGALYERPSPYVGTYLLLASGTVPTDVSSCGGCTASSTRPRPCRHPDDDTSLTVAFTYQGLKALGVPQDSLDSFAPEFREGMAARAEILGDTGESAPEHWEAPLGSPDVHVAIAVLSSDEDRAREPSRSRARAAHAELPGVDLVWRQDCYQLATGRTSFGFKDGIGQPAVEGSGRRADEHPGPSAQGRGDHPGLPRRDGRAAAHADPGRAGSQRHLRRVPQAAHEGGGLPELPPRPGGEPGGGGPARREDRRPLAERRTPRGLARRGRRRSSAATRGATTTSATATTLAVSSARWAPTHAGPTHATPSTTTAAWTSGCTG